MHRQTLVIVITILFLLTTMIPLSVGSEINSQSISNMLYVGGNGPGNYTRIQDAINNASDGDTVFVYVRTYPYFENLIINKSINLVGEDKNAVVIDGNKTGDVISIRADIVTVAGFTIQRSGGGASGIEILHANNIKIYEVIITSTYEECIRLTATQNCVITGNQFIINDGRGILLDSSNNTLIGDNIFSKNSNDGVAVLYSSSYNNISQNIFSDSLGGIWLDGPCAYNYISTNVMQNHSSFGIWSCTSTNNNTIKNNVINETNFGMILNNTRDNTIQGNDINNVTTGMHLCFARHGHILENCFSNTEIGIECCVSSDYNLFYHNNFLTNVEHAYDDSTNIWDDGYPSGGNYWDDYNGTDENGDGIGDSPYHILGGYNQDRYPLMEPWYGENHPPNAPVIIGKINGKAGVAYNYSFSAIDPDIDTVYFWIEWGDGCPAVEWLGPYASGDIIIISHIFEEKGDYIISAKVKDEYDAESDWGTLEVSMPFSYSRNYPAWQWLHIHYPLWSRLLDLLERLE